jgi:hypothetical protein
MLVRGGLLLGRCWRLCGGLLGRSDLLLVRSGLPLGRRLRLRGGLLLRRGRLRELLLARPRSVVGRHRALDVLLLLGRSRPATLAHAGSATYALAEVVELGPSDVAPGRHLDPLDLRRVQRERPLDPHPERLLADRERLAHAGALTPDHDPLEHLRPAAVALHDLEVDADSVARLEHRDAPQLSSLEAFDDT